MLNIPKFNPHLKAIHNDQECLLLLHHLNIAIQEMSCPSQGNILHFLKIMKFRHFSESPQIHGSLTWELILQERRAMSMFGLISKNYQFRAKQKIKFLVVSDFEASF